MAVIRYLSILSVLLCSCVWAQAKAVIEGPSDSLAGDLVVLNSDKTEAHVKRWIIPTQLEGRYLRTEHQIAFSVREGGEFRYALIAVEVTGETEADVDVATHVVQVTGGICDPAPVPDDPPEEPGPGPIEPPSRLLNLSKDAATQLNDPETVRRLVPAIRSVQLGTLAEMSEAARVAIDGVLLSREGASRDKDWLGIWRRPINEAMANNATPEKRLAELKVIADGLALSLENTSSPIAPKPRVSLEMKTRDDCTWCEKFKREQLSKIESLGWAFAETQSSGSVPVFTIQSSGESITVVGYRTADELLALAP